MLRDLLRCWAVYLLIMGAIGALSCAVTVRHEVDAGQLARVEALAKPLECPCPCPPPEVSE